MATLTTLSPWSPNECSCSPPRSSDDGRPRGGGPVHRYSGDHGWFRCQSDKRLTRQIRPRQREQSRPVEPLMTRQQITVPSKIADLNPRVVTETSLHLLIGPLEQIGIDPERGGQGWRCAIALVFVLAKPRPADGYPAAKAYVGSVDFFGQNAEAQRREWINSQRGKGRDVLQLPTRQAIEALDRADGKKLCQYGILPAKSRS